MAKSNLPKRSRKGRRTTGWADEHGLDQINNGGLVAYDLEDAFDKSSGTRDQIAKVLDILFRQRWLILIVFILVLGLTSAYTFTREPIYEAPAFVAVDLGSVSVDIGRGNLENTDAGFELFARSDRSLTGEIRLLEISDQLVQRVAERISRQGTLIGSNGFEGIPKGKVDFVAERGADNIIRFVGSSAEPEHAALMANLYAEEYVYLTQEASRSHALALRKSLEEKEAEQRADLEAIEGQIERFKLAGTVALDDESSRLIQQITDIEFQLDEVRSELEVERAVLTSLESELQEINPLIARRIASGVENRIETLRAQLAEEEEAKAKVILENPELLDRETEALNIFNSRIQRLRDEIDSLSTQYVNEVDAAGGITGSSDGLSYIATLRQQISEKKINITRLEAQLTLLQSRLANLQINIRNLPRQSLELTQLERRRTLIEGNYQNTSIQLQEVLLVEDTEPGYARVVRKAIIPKWSVYPNIPNNIILGLFFGFLLGIVISLMRDRLDNRIYQTDQIRKMGFKEIGVIPDLAPLIEDEYGGEEKLLLNGRQFSTSLVSLLNPISSASEAYRSIRTNIQYSVPDEIMQTVLVSSSGVSEGKSTTAANLAIVMAQAGLKTLLVDGDLRRPRIHRLFGLSLSNGLVEVLSDDNKYDPGAWLTSVPNLSVLTAGNPMPRSDNHEPGPPSTSNKIERRRALILNPSELLSSQQMGDMLVTFRRDYEIIIIDTPPVLVATDAAVLSAQCDATIIVAKAGETREDELELAIEQVEDVGGFIPGILLNGFDIKMAYGHKYKYQSYSAYKQYGNDYSYYRQGDVSN